MRCVVLVLVGAFTCLAGNPTATAAVPGWSYTHVPGQSAEPLAVFGSWNGDSVIFEARCDAGELVLTYFGGELPLTSLDKIILTKMAGEAVLRTRLIDGRLQGRRKADLALQRLLTAEGELEIEAPNIMGEPWYVGHAEPLQRVVAHCLTSRRP